MPYIFCGISLGLISLASLQAPKTHADRSLAAVHDCQQIVRTITSAKNEKDRSDQIVYKFKNSIWNKIISNKDFEQFDEAEYLRWQEIYRDSKDISKLNPVSIEQKLALIEVLNSKQLIALESQGPSLAADINKLSALKLKKLAKHLEKWDLSSKLSRNDINDFASDLFIILKGPPVSLLDYFTSNKTALQNTRLVRVVQEDLLMMGLRGMLERIPEKEAYSRFENGRFLVQKFFQHKGWKYMVLPYDLPWMEKLKIPDELLQKILVDGLSVHNRELIEHLHSQNMIDHYERFRKVYRPMAFTVGFLFYYQKFNVKFYEDMKENQEEEKLKFIQIVENINGVLEDEISQNTTDDLKLKNEQYSRLLLQFRFHYGEDPSPEEKEAIRKKVFDSN